MYFNFHIERGGSDWVSYMFNTADVWDCMRAERFLIKLLHIIKNTVLPDLIIPLNLKKYTHKIDIPNNITVNELLITISPGPQTFGYIECKYYNNNVPVYINGSNKRIFKTYPSLIMHIRMLTSLESFVV